MDDIKSGKGLPPLSENDNSSDKSDIRMKERTDKGITYQTFSLKNTTQKNDKDD